MQWILSSRFVMDPKQRKGYLVCSSHVTVNKGYIGGYSMTIYCTYATSKLAQLPVSAVCMSPESEI